MLIDKYNDPQAVEMREELRKLQSQFEELRYKETLIAREAQEKQKEYMKYLGVLDENEEKEKEKGKEENGC